MPSNSDFSSMSYMMLKVERKNHLLLLLINLFVFTSMAYVLYSADWLILQLIAGYFLVKSLIGIVLPLPSMLRVHKAYKARKLKIELEQQAFEQELESLSRADKAR